MLYTLLKFLGWGALLAVIGGCVGWALRALKCRGEVARARATTVDEDEVERMRHRLANLEQVVAERDRLRMQVADMRHADSPGVVGIAADDVAVPTDTDDVFGDADSAEASDVASPDADAAPDADDGAAEAEVVAAAESVDDADPTDDAASGSIVPESAGDDDDAAASTTVAGFAGAADEPADDASDDASEASDAEPVELDLDAAADAIGKKIKLDDLTVVEGIGPKIAELCSGIGVNTWQQLADTEVGALQSMLDDAGSRFQVHKPGTWPRQAGLLASGQWAEFKTLTDELDGGV